VRTTQSSQVRMLHHATRSNYGISESRCPRAAALSVLQFSPQPRRTPIRAPVPAMPSTGLSFSTAIHLNAARPPDLCGFVSSPYFTRPLHSARLSPRSLHDRTLAWFRKRLHSCCAEQPRLVDHACPTPARFPLSFISFGDLRSARASDSTSPPFSSRPPRYSCQLFLRIFASSPALSALPA